MHRLNIIIHECNRHTCNALICVPVQVNVVIESRVNFLFSQRISPDNQPVCREMWGQIISFGGRDNLTPLFAINQINTNGQPEGKIIHWDLLLIGATLCRHWLDWMKSSKQHLVARYIRGKQYVIILTNILLICVIYHYNWYNKHCQGICEQVLVRIRLSIF